MIGINTAIISPTGGSVGIGFAIPSDMVKRVVTQLIDNGKVTRGYLGVAGTADLAADGAGDGPANRRPDPMGR